MKLRIVGIGGTLREGSASEQALRIALNRAADLGARTRIFRGAELAQLPMYTPESRTDNTLAAELVAELRSADGMIIASPGYHGGPSGLIKNALDYTEDLRNDRAPYLTNRSVGLIVTASGWQAAVTALTSLRSVTHALRGWATPYGAVINSTEVHFTAGHCSEDRVERQLQLVADEVIDFARRMPRRQQDSIATPAFSQ